MFWFLCRTSVDEEYIINKCIIIIIPKHPVVVEIYLSGLKWMTDITGQRNPLNNWLYVL